MEDLEQIMRKIHVLFAKCEPYGNEKGDRIIVPKKEVFRLLEQLNYAIVQMMDQYEGTAESRERGLGEYQRKGSKILEEAQYGAEDIYAASLIYTDNMIYELGDVLADARENLREDYSRLSKRLDEQAGILKANQQEIKEQLQAMVQGEKYLNIIYKENLRLRRIQADKAGEESREGSEDGDYFEEGDFEEEGFEEDSGEEGFDESDFDENDDGPETTGGMAETDIGPLSEPQREDAAEGGGAAKTAITGQDATAGKGEAGKPDNGQEPKKRQGKKGGKTTPKKKVRKTIDLEAEWEREQEGRPVRKIGTALYQDVGQAYDPPVKKVSYEIKVNQAYFDQIGESSEELDAEYYQWVEEREGKKDGGTTPEGTEEPKKQGKKKLKFKFGRKKQK